MSNPNAIGRIIPPGVLFIRSHIGSADVEKDGEKFNINIALSVGQQCPVIECVETGKSFVLDWSAILELANQAGILEGPRKDRRER